MSTMTLQMNKRFNNRASVTQALTDNRGTYTINKDGYVSLDLSNDDVRRAIVSEIRKLDNIKEVKR